MLTRQKRILEASKKRLIPLGLAVIFNVTLAGLVCGTFAWYTYATRAQFQEAYKGTTVTDAGFLRIGLVSPHRLWDCDRYNLEMDDSFLYSTYKYIYWSASNNLSAESINYVISAEESGTTVIEPTTSGSNDAINENGFHLYKKPVWSDPYQINSGYYAHTSSYVSIQFIFKIAASEGGSSNANVYFSDCVLSTSNDSNLEAQIHKAVRFHIKNAQSSIIVSPSSQDDGENNVGGILDLDGDGFYDFNPNNLREVVYGESANESTYFDNPTLEDGNIPKGETTSFLANHKKGVYALNEDSFEPKTVSYFGISRLLSREYPMATPDSRFGGLSYGELDIYLEGWDTHLTNEEEESAFNLDLSFSA